MQLAITLSSEAQTLLELNHLLPPLVLRLGSASLAPLV